MLTFELTHIMPVFFLSRIADVSLSPLPRDWRAKHASGWLETGRGNPEEEP